MYDIIIRYMTTQLAIRRRLLNDVRCCGRNRPTPETPEGRKALGEIPTEVAWQLEYTYRSICCCTVDVKICNDLYGSSIGDNFC